MENITTILVAITAMITGIAGMIAGIASLITTIIKSKSDVKSALPKKIKNQVSIDSEITNELENLKEYLMADRVQIYDFHNRRSLCKSVEVH